ncbi:MAG: tRNA (N6-isopentenyl adenosine(37)-C2)-methylthiotransferase MiaB [Lachnospiraceae bacterium]|nr:tRNA (N6-isopentenyl adenosine(37)-C2)-methylthiotransferase MiaB [Lachnospiraceae bacterium]
MFQMIDFDTIDLLAPAPQGEPMRQYYFIAGLRKWVQDREKALGRKLTFQCRTFGCQMNAKDSEKFAGMLEEMGFVSSEEEATDLIVYNTCTVRENANQRVYGHLGNLKTIKKKHPKMMIAMCGCMMQEPDVVEKLKKSYPFIDIIFGTHNIFKFPELIQERIDTGRMVVDIWDGTDMIVENLPSERKYSFKSGVNITYGCNNFCSYCIVPYVRGRERSRKPEDIIKEVKELAKDGVTEVMLLGQNVNSYGKNLETPMSFSALLEEIEKIDGIERIRFMTSHPKDLSPELIQVMANSKKICRHFHLPLQSGSSRVLKVMNRRYTKERYLELVNHLREAMPDISLTTDIIVGFPGETEEDFLETMDVVEKARFDSAYTFIYSKRTGTPAAAMEDQVPEEVIKDRFDRLLKLVGTISHERTKRWEGQTLPVLVEEKNRQLPDYVTGRLEYNTVVHFPGDESLIGKIVNVHLTEAKGFYYMGEMEG